MPKLPVVSGEEAVRAFTRGGFRFRRQRSSHVQLADESGQILLSVPVHSGEDLPPGTLRRLVSQSGLTVDEFRRLLK